MNIEIEYKLLKINGDNIIIIGQSLFRVILCSNISNMPCKDCLFNGYVRYHPDTSLPILCNKTESVDEICSAGMIGDKILCNHIYIKLNNVVYFTELNRPYNLFLSSFLRNKHLRSSYDFKDNEVIRSIILPKKEDEDSVSVLTKFKNWIHDKIRR